MADEFAKGLAILTGGGLVWMAISAWLTTESFEGTQLIAPPPEDPGTYAELVLLLRDVTAGFVIIGVITFWFLIPAFYELRDYFDERSAEA
ncbi:hypothetical protein GJ631_12435 [Natronomonas sp. CBA1123]|jgi:hypothetical protein|uniref:DUF7314 family protein n=1 Tax=Natronomonas sp. CBA1123 TaxID=2668070 RepID=UPI0012EA6ACD|nr:hypothetical protein [Natronomonas sp. CBA1123]MUV87347.1 hypothetical protein [Natronomonas sp. CBA1123]